MAGSDDQGSSRKGANTLVAVAGLFTTLAAAVITALVANQGIEANANAQRAGQIADQRRAVYADFISSTGALCNSLNPDQITHANINNAYVAMLTQKARLTLIAPGSLMQPTQNIVDYILNDATQPVDKNKPDSDLQGCESKRYEDLIASFLQVAQSEL